MPLHINDNDDIGAKLTCFLPSNRPPDRIVLPTLDDEGTSLYFSCRDPSSISEEEARSHAVSMWYFTDDAFVYYIYPFLCAIVSSKARDDVVCGHFLAQFPMDADRERVERGNRILSKLTTKQLCVLVDIFALIISVYTDSSTFELSRRIQRKLEEQNPR